MELDQFSRTLVLSALLATQQAEQDHLQQTQEQFHLGTGPTDPTGTGYRHSARGCWTDH